MEVTLSRVQYTVRCSKGSIDHKQATACLSQAEGTRSHFHIKAQSLRDRSKNSMRK